MRTRIVWVLSTAVLAAILGCGGGGGDGETALRAENSAAARTEVLAAGESGCVSGGIRVDAGIDDNGNSVLDDVEVDSSQVVCNGAPGADGTNGLAGLVDVAAEAAGGNCTHGGQKIRSGNDADNDGQLDADEVAALSYVCNGAPGTGGTNGTNGTDGATALVNVSPEAAGGNCTYGGRKIESGSDADGDGQLDTGEVIASATSYVCNGAPGTNGTDGTNGTNGLSSAVRLQTVAAGVGGCALGGVQVDVGIDSNGNGELDDGEVGDTEYVCNAALYKSLTVTTPEPAGLSCPGGGQRIETGLDVNGDETLQGTEVMAYSFTCNPPSPPRVLYVDDDSPAETPDGASWETAYRHPQDAMNAANWGDEIWVAEGWYESSVDFDSAFPLLVMKDGVSVYGGFAGTETARGERDPATYATEFNGASIKGASHALLSGVRISGAEPYPGTVVDSASAENFTLADCVISDNSAGSDYGELSTGGIAISSGWVRNCTFFNNSGTTAPVYVPRDSAGTVKVEGCLFYENFGYYSGGVLASGSGVVEIVNSTFFSNWSNSNGWLYVEQGLPGQTGHTYVTNTIAWSTGGIVGWTAPVVSYSDIEGGYSGTGNIDADPLFSNPFNFPPDFSLQPGSPAIDAGNNAAVPAYLTADVAGNPRIADDNDDAAATVNMGAFEGPPAAPPIE
jgi:hypothetical protein